MFFKLREMPKSSYRKQVYLNPDENKFFNAEMKKLGYPSDAEFLREIIKYGLAHVPPYDPTARLKSS